MSYFRHLSSERLYLSPMRAEDAERYCEWLNDLEVMRYLGSMASRGPQSLQAERLWLESQSKGYQYAIVLNDGDRLIGNCGINHYEPTMQCAELGIFIGDKQSWNKGYGREALGLLVEYAFNWLNIHNLCLRVASSNARAIACYQKLGFRECGRLHECFYVDGRWVDAITMELLHGQWTAQRARQED